MKDWMERTLISFVLLVEIAACSIFFDFIGAAWWIPIVVLYPLVGFWMWMVCLPEATWKTFLFLIVFWLPALLSERISNNVP